MRIAAITGAGSGIGRETAIRLHDDGCHVVVIDRDAGSAAETAGLVGGTPVVADVARPDDVAACAAMLTQEFGVIDVLVNNAAFWVHQTLAEVTEEDAQAIVDVNVLGPWRVVSHLLPLFTRGGAIVNVASIGFDCPPADAGLYPMTKGAIVGLTRQLAVQLGARSIRVNAVSPGLIRTPASEGAYADGGRERYVSLLPVPRSGEPSDVADVISFLAGDGARYVTGEVIRVDGGLVVRGPGDRRA